jgi:hypothetical protein
LHLIYLSCFGLWIGISIDLISSYTLEYKVAAFCSPLNKTLDASLKVILFIAEIIIGLASIAAASAALLMLNMTLSASLFKPALRSISLTFWASSGKRI